MRGLSRSSAWAIIATASIGLGGRAGVAWSQSAPETVAIPAVTEMELIPAGEFIVGREGSGDSAPPHAVRLKAFLIDTHEVTNAQYFRFCQETGHSLPFFWGMREFHSSLDFPDHPVVGVSWGDAVDYAMWVGKRLPSEAEWEVAARGGLEAKRFPSGDDVQKEEANFSSGGSLRVASLLPNGYGLYDMAGNVREWVMDYYDEHFYATSPVESPTGPEKGSLAAVRGGGWVGGKMCVTVHSRIGLPPTWVDVAVGFRCARDAPKDEVH